MAINPMKWKTRNILYTSLTLLVFYVLFVYKKKHHILFEEIIKDSNPIHVWEYVADFSNMKTLNPTMYVKHYTSLFSIFSVFSFFFFFLSQIFINAFAEKILILLRKVVITIIGNIQLSILNI